MVSSSLVQAIESTQNEALKAALNNVLETHLGSGVILTARANSAEVRMLFWVFYEFWQCQCVSVSSGEARQSL